VQAVAVDLARRDRPHRDLLRAGEDGAKELLPPRRGQLLRVVEQCQRPDAMVAQAAVIEKHSGDDERPREGATSGLVRPGDEPRA
jgi:hypothetical protein